jgi:hypothetical protein
VGSIGILPSPNVKTAYSRRGIVPFTRQPSHGEGHMPVTIGRRALIAALGGAIAAWPLAAWAQQPAHVGRGTRRRPPQLSHLLPWRL